MNGKIGLDFDCVICDLHRGINDYIRNKFNMFLDLEEGYPCLEVEKNYYFSQAVSSDLLEVMHTEVLLEFSEPCMHAKSALLNLRPLFSEIVIVTSRHDYEKEFVCEWLDKYEIVYDDMYFTSSHNKGQIVKDIGVSAFVDDNQDTINDILHSNIELECGLYIINKPWNKFFNNYSVFRINDLEDVVCYTKLYDQKGACNENYL